MVKLQKPTYETMVAKDFQGYRIWGAHPPNATPKFPQEIGALLRDY